MNAIGDRSESGGYRDDRNSPNRRRSPTPAQIRASIQASDQSLCARAFAMSHSAERDSNGYSRTGNARLDEIRDAAFFGGPRSMNGPLAQWIKNAIAYFVSNTAPSGSYSSGSANQSGGGSSDNGREPARDPRSGNGWTWSRDSAGNSVGTRDNTSGMWGH